MCDVTAENYGTETIGLEKYTEPEGGGGGGHRDGKSKKIRRTKKEGHKP